jgi:hypothetical protein
MFMMPKLIEQEKLTLLLTDGGLNTLMPLLIWSDDILSWCRITARQISEIYGDA